MRAVRHILVALFAAALLFTPTQALAANASGGESVPQITDRYASINDLTTAQNSDERVIIDTTVQVLTAANRALNGLDVRFVGETVGDVLAADKGHKWVNVLGTSGASIGVYMTDEQVERVINLGNYHTAGSTLEIEGTYTMACSDHQGELDVHATSVRCLDTGGKVTHAVKHNRFLVAIALCAVGFVLFSTFILLRRRSEARKLKEKTVRS